MENRIDAFITKNDLNENIKDALIDFVNGCFIHYAGHMSKEWLAAAVSNKSTSVSKTKKDKLEDPTAAETIEIYAFMEAADESKRQGGVPVSVGEVLSKAEREATRKVATLIDSK